MLLPHLADLQQSASALAELDVWSTSQNVLIR